MKHCFSILTLSLVILLAAAFSAGCGGGEPTERAAPTTGGEPTAQPMPTTGGSQPTEQPAPTTERATATPSSAGNTPAPTTERATATPSSAGNTPAPTTERATATQVPTLTPTPAPTATPEPSPTPEPPAVAWEGAAALLPSRLGEVEVWDWEAAMSIGIGVSDIPTRYSWWYIGWLAEDPANSGVSFEDVRSFAFALVETEQGPYMNIGVLEGDLDLAKAQEFLENLFARFPEYDDPEEFRESYKGYVIYEDQDKALVLLDDKDAIAFGDPPEAVKVLVDAVASGSGLLLHGNEYKVDHYKEHIGMALNRLGGGFYAKVGTGSSSSSFVGCCWASGYSVSGSGGELEVTIVYPFHEEGRSEGQVENVRVHLEGNLPDEAALEDVEADGFFVVGTATVAADVWQDAFHYYWSP